MATGAAGDGVFRNIFEGCIGSDTGIQRRPYHRNCSCALHESDGRCSHSSRGSNLSFPIRRTWSEGSLTLMSQSSSVQSSRETSPSSCNLPSAPVAKGMVRAQTCLMLVDQE